MSQICHYLLPILSGLPDSYPWTDQPPVDVLLSTMSLGQDYATYPIKALGSNDLEKWLFNSLEIFLFTQIQKGFSIDPLLDYLSDHYPWTNADLSDNFPDRDMLRRICHRKVHAREESEDCRDRAIMESAGELMSRIHLPIQPYARTTPVPAWIRARQFAGDSVWVAPGSEWPVVFRPRQKHKKTAKDEAAIVVLLTSS
jgi:hypothetical protein